jgi:tetratricopeptide (TPR) repeat protein
MASSRLATGFGMRHSTPVLSLGGVGMLSEVRSRPDLQWLPINGLRRLALRLERIPLIGRFVHLPVKVLRGLVQDGFSVTRTRIAARIPFLHSAVHLRRQLVPSFGLWQRAIQVVRREGLTFAVRKARSRLGAVSDMKRLNPLVPPGRADMLREIRSVRALLAVEAVLADFERKLHFDGIQSAPLAFVRRKLEDLRGGQPLGRTLEARLVELTKYHRSWAEAWLELGFLHQDQGNADQALACFERAMGGSRLSDRAPRNISPQALGAANHGRLLIAEGRYQEACASFAAGLVRDPEQKALAVEYANALRQLGQVDLALTYYGEGMFYQESRWNLPPPPRDANSLSFPHLVPPERLHHKRGPLARKAYKGTLQNVGT